MVFQAGDAWPETVDDAVGELLRLLGWNTNKLVRDTPEAHLTARFHHGLGTSIRNHFGLWEGNTSLLDSCGDIKFHPDDASAVIIKAFWQRLQFLPSVDLEIISAN
jgi:hypothetical protein